MPPQNLIRGRILSGADVSGQNDTGLSEEYRKMIGEPEPRAVRA